MDASALKLTPMFSQINRRFCRWLNNRTGNADEFTRVEIVGQALELHAVSGVTSTSMLLEQIKRITVADVSVGTVDLRTAWFEFADGAVLSVNADMTGWAAMWKALPDHLPISCDACVSVLLGNEAQLDVVFDRDKSE
jgi:hypothetical protein